MLAKGFLSFFYFKLSIRASFLIRRGIITYKRGKLSPRIISILMTLKLWGKEDEADSDEEEFGEDTN